MVTKVDKIAPEETGQQKLWQDIFDGPGPVQGDNEPVEDPIDEAQADTDAALGKLKLREPVLVLSLTSS